jgi:hypothetical protein
MSFRCFGHIRRGIQNISSLTIAKEEIEMLLEAQKKMDASQKKAKKKKAKTS